MIIKRNTPVKLLVQKSSIKIELNTYIKSYIKLYSL